MPVNIRNFKIQICFNVIFCYGVGCAYYPEDSDEEARVPPYIIHTSIHYYSETVGFLYRTTPD